MTADSTDNQPESSSARGKLLLTTAVVVPLLAILLALNFRSYFDKPSYTLDIKQSNSSPIKIDRGQQAFRSSDIVDIRQGDNITMILTKSGRVYANGDNVYGEQAKGKFGGTSTNMHAINFGSDVKITQIDTTNKHVVALSDSGDVWTWGRNLSGQLGNNSHTDSAKPVKVFSDATDIAAGYRFSAAVNKSGELWAWGMDCDPNLPGLAELTQAFAQDISIGGTYYDGVGPTDSTDCLNQQNLPIASLQPRRIASPVKYTAVSAGYGHLLMIDTDRKAWGFGCNGWGQLGRGHNQNTGKTRVVSPVAFPAGVQIAELEAGFRHSIARDTDGNVWTWGHNEKGEVVTYGTNKSDKPAKVRLDGSAGEVRAGYDISTVLIGGRLLAAGNNEAGQLISDQAVKGVYMFKNFKDIDKPVDKVSIGYNSLLYWKR